MNVLPMVDGVLWEADPVDLNKRDPRELAQALLEAIGVLGRARSDNDCIRATLLLNFGEGQGHRHGLPFVLKDEGQSTLRLLIVALENLVELAKAKGPP